MEIVYKYLIQTLWLSWGVYWLIKARDVKTLRRQESVISRIAHIGPLVIAVLLLTVPNWPITFLYERFLRGTELTFFVGALMVASGLGFAVWARVILGRNWSGTVTLKHDHELIRSGPYRWVRHPIYTGLLLAFLGSAIALGQWRGLIALFIVFVALWRKLRLEERWMRETFGEAYGQYRAEVAALIPFLL
jgi:protein-S-isoprenylcysteine O-methyltransferase Ste14